MDSVSVPGRVNLIGEHIDYHSLAVLPMAIGRAIRVCFRARPDGAIRVASAGAYGVREFQWTAGLTPAAAGDWENYLRAAAEAVGRKWGVGAGIEASVESDLPSAAGLSSSSALLVAIALCLLRANGIAASFEELMEILPDGEQFVGTRGGGMDHAAVLASRQGCASLIEFDPLSVRPIAIPADWAFLVAHSLEHAEKSGGLRAEYNARRTAGASALEKLGLGSYRKVDNPLALARRLDAGLERDSFLHVATEARRVREAAAALERGDAAQFGSLLSDSHASLRDRLRVSCAALDRLVEAAMESGAMGARLTGAGFGGCIVAFCRTAELPALESGLITRYYQDRPGFVREDHLIRADASPGALAGSSVPTGLS